VCGGQWQRNDLLRHDRDVITYDKPVYSSDLCEHESLLDIFISLLNVPVVHLGSLRSAALVTGLCTTVHVLAAETGRDNFYGLFVEWQWARHYVL